VIQTSGEQQRINISGKVVAEQSGNKLNYEKENSAEELAYNILTIPNGKKFQVVLSDGTEVHLNSGTVLRYPVKFIAGLNRKVYLLQGEAYFDVAKDVKHPFVVNADYMNVRVLGTEFNVSTYPEDLSINTVLVEGAVSIFGNDKKYDNANSLELKPGFKASWNKDKNNISVEEVDTNIYTSWINGKLIFKNSQFKNIIKKLERHYNVTIINNNAKLNEQYYDATFDTETIEQVLNSFNKSYKIEYTITNNKIIIN
ncbi:MAG: FecR family protein, partial [Bacteroidales bacterium]|nr:FecR family protein [Bacteroidales bacterium]